MVKWRNFLFFALISIFSHVVCSTYSFALTCPMGYRQAGTDCVRVVDGRSRFALSQKALNFYYSVVLPCEGDPSKFASCGSLWYQFQLANGEIRIPDPPSVPNKPNSNASEINQRKKENSNDCNVFDPGCSSQPSEAKSNPPSQVSDNPKKPPRTTKNDEPEKSAENRSSQSKKGVATESASCWSTGSDPVDGKPMCDSSGKPSCWVSEAQKRANFPQCDSLGRPIDTEVTRSEDVAPAESDNTQTTDNLPQGFPQPPEVESDKEYCSSAHKKANICCNDPVKCVTGLDGPSSSTVSAVGSLVMGAVGMMAMNGAAGSGDSEGIAKSCELMKLVSLGGATANTALGAKCFSDKGSCEDRCQEVVDKYRRVIGECSNLETVNRQNGGKGPLCPSSWVLEYREAYASAHTRIERCTGFNANVAAMGSQAAQSVAASGFADLCAKAATTQATGFPNIDQQPVFSGDCNDPANASNPICVKCRGPEAKYDPLCGGLSGAGGSASSGSTSAFQDPDFGTRLTDGSDLNVPDDIGQAQDPIFDGGSGQAASANSIPNNGGGFTGGSGGGGLPFSGGGGGYGGGPGYDTDIMNGLGGGGGYSVTSVPTESPSGYSGAGTLANGERSPNPFDKFDLKKYMPKSGEELTRRPASSLLGNNPEIGRADQDIFEMIHRRYQIMCKQGRMIGCEKNSPFDYYRSK
ncbi:MAG: hypothetical protein KDD35_00065 [Bdellovibrionales bacterium]|nr:hypothetical protein [Bdellovibrionales bacterium]